MAREPGVSIDARQRAVRYDVDGVDGVAATRESEKRYAGARGDRAWLQKLAQGFGQRKRLRQRTAERALAHTVARKLDVAYYRTGLQEQRRPMMEAWTTHIMID